MMDPKTIKPGAMIELRDEETESWIPLTIVAVSEDGNVMCHTIMEAPILTKTSSLITGARLRPRDGSCRDCGDEAHDGPCIERLCSECGAPVSSRCSQHPTQPVHVYRPHAVISFAAVTNDHQIRVQWERSFGSTPRPRSLHPGRPLIHVQTPHLDVDAI